MTAKDLLLTMFPNTQVASGILSQDEVLDNNMLRGIIKELNNFAEFKNSEVEIIDVEFSEPVMTKTDNGVTFESECDPDITNALEHDHLRFAPKVKLYSIYLTHYEGEARAVYRVTPDSILPFDEWRDNRLDEIL